jgi:hypothetical protein
MPILETIIFLWHRSLKPLKKRIYIVVFGNVGEKLVWEVGKSSLLDFRYRYSRPHYFSRGCLRKGENRSLEHWTPKFFVKLAKCVLVVLANTTFPQGP